MVQPLRSQRPIRIQFGPDQLSDPIAPAILDEVKQSLRRAQVPDAEPSLDQWAAAVIHATQDDTVRDQMFNAVNSGAWPRGLIVGYQLLEQKAQAPVPQPQQAPAPAQAEQAQPEPKPLYPNLNGQVARPRAVPLPGDRPAASALPLPPSLIAGPAQVGPAMGDRMAAASAASEAQPAGVATMVANIANPNPPAQQPEADIGGKTPGRKRKLTVHKKVIRDHLGNIVDIIEEHTQED